MKNLFPLLLLFCIACNSRKTISLEKQIDSLKQELNNTYKPGLGELMSSIQIHHAKLWSAGVNSNWRLADFEINEIKETVDDIEKYCFDRPESKMLRVSLMPAVDSLANTFLKQNENNSTNFKKGFAFLTTSCNNCHKKNSFGFIEITIPHAPLISNQDFTTQPVVTRKFTAVDH